VKITKKERDALIKKISKASGIAQYALTEKMNDAQVIEAAQHLEVFQLVKDANNYNRYRQGQRTKAANDKLKEFLAIDNSEIVKTGKWLLSVLSKTGSDRKQALLEKDLVHKEDYNETVSDMRDTIITIEGSSKETVTDAQATISDLEKRIDALRQQQLKVQEYIVNNYGAGTWRMIKTTFNIK
jgi:hypothetical protein